MRWVPYVPMLELFAGDVVYLESGEIAFINGDAVGEPSSLCSIPEGWSCDLCYHGSDDKCGLKRKTGILRNFKGEKIDRIVLVLRGAGMTEAATKLLEKVKV